MKHCSSSLAPRELFAPGLVLALVLLGAWVAPRWRGIAVPIQVALGVLGCSIIAARAWATGVGPAELGLQAKNLLSATCVFGLVTAALTVPWVLEGDGDLLSPFPMRELPSYFLWALFQQYVVVGGFWLPFRRAFGRDTKTSAAPGGEVLLAGAVALVFAAAHAPNVGLMALVGLAEWIWLFLFARWRNIFSLSLAHAMAALVAAHHLIPRWWLPSMRVGLDYFGS